MTLTATTRDDQLDPRPAYQSLYVVQRGMGTGFVATIRGHVLELASPYSGHSLAPTPDDLFVAAIASELAWSTRALLQAHGLPEDVSIVANWRSLDDLPGPADIAVTATVERDAETAYTDIADLFARGLATRLRTRPRIHVSMEGARQ
jgi:hypothetical protein